MGRPRAAIAIGPFNVRPHMTSLAGVALSLACFLMSATYFRLALQDHRLPSRPPSWWSVARSSLIFTVLSGAAIGSQTSDPKQAATLASICLGLIVAPALAPPFFVDKEVEPSRLRRWTIAADSMATAFIQHKVVAAVVFVVCLLLSPGLWYWIVGLIAGLLLVGKFSKMVEVESGGPGMPLLPSAMRRGMKRMFLATLSFSILWGFAPYAVLSHVPVGPESWSAFAGLGLGVLLTFASSPK